jgi:hydrogenase nickel incorporation protein HypA/HybF
MHELSLTLELVAMAGEAAKGRAVVKVVLEVGREAGVVADALRFAFDLCTEGTLLEGASLEVIETEGPELRIRELEVARCAESVDAARTTARS